MLQPVASWGDRCPHNVIKRLSGGAVNERPYWTKLSSMRRVWDGLGLCPKKADMGCMMQARWRNS